jgi:hypothetical protein
MDPVTGFDSRVARVFGALTTASSSTSGSTATRARSGEGGGGSGGSGGGGDDDDREVNAAALINSREHNRHSGSSGTVCRPPRDRGGVYVPPSRRADDFNGLAATQTASRAHHEPVDSASKAASTEYQQQYPQLQRQSHHRSHSKRKHPTSTFATSRQHPRRTPSERVPHFLQDKRRFKRYSLDDVDTSERMNTSAAFAFLNAAEQVRCGGDGGGGSEQPAVDGPLQVGRGAVQFRPSAAISESHRHEMRGTASGKSAQRRGKLLEEVVVGCGQGAGASRRRGQGLSGVERARRAGLLPSSGGGGEEEEADAAAQGASSGGTMTAQARELQRGRPPKKKKKRNQAAKPATRRAVMLSHLDGDELDR